MPTYILFINYTDQGLRDIKESPPRAEAFKQTMQYSSGVRILGLYRMMGPYDLVSVVEAPNEEVVAAGALKVVSFGNVKVQFYRAYNEEEFAGIIKDLNHKQ